MLSMLSMLAIRCPIYVSRCHQEAVTASDFIAFVPADSSRVVRATDGPARGTAAENVGAEVSGQHAAGGKSIISMLPAVNL